jgi:hypothetical protein
LLSARVNRTHKLISHVEVPTLHLSYKDSEFNTHVHSENTKKLPRPPPLTSSLFTNAPFKSYISLITCCRIYLGLPRRAFYCLFRKYSWSGSENSDVQRTRNTTFYGAYVKVNTRSRKRTYCIFVLKSLKLCCIWIGHPLCRFCLLKHGFEGKTGKRIEATRRRGRRISG